MKNYFYILFAFLGASICLAQSRDCVDCVGERDHRVSFRGTNVNDLKTIPMRIEGFQLANGGTFNQEYVELLCSLASGSDPKMFQNMVGIIFGDFKEKKAKELFHKVYPHVKCGKDGNNLIQMASYMGVAQNVQYMIRAWEIPLNVYKNSKGETEVDYLLSEANRMKVTQNLKEIPNEYMLIYRYLRHPKMNVGEIGKFSCEIDKSCTCNVDDLYDFGKSCGKWK